MLQTFVKGGRSAVKEHCDEVRTTIFEDVPESRIGFGNRSHEAFDGIRTEESADGKSGYVIFAPDYVSNSAGVKCLHALCADLNRLGYPSWITPATHTREDLVDRLIPQELARDLLSKGHSSVVYPETVSGNPLGAGRVIRWVLNRPGLLGGDEVYDPEEKVFAYSAVYTPYIKNRLAGMLYMPTIDQEIFFDPEEEERSLECYYVGKSAFKEGLFDPTEVFEITRESPAKKELGKLFRHSKVLYNFDNSTILTYEAIMCGCPVVIIPDGTQTWEDYQASELGTAGIAWGPENLAQARADVPLLKDAYVKVQAEYQRQLRNFIEVTQDWRCG